MTPTPQITIESVFSDALALRTRKNADYGGSYDRNFRRWGYMYTVPRLTEKVERIEQITKNGAACSDEGIEQEYLDIAVIALNAVRCMREDEVPDVHKALR